MAEEEGLPDSRRSRAALVGIPFVTLTVLLMFLPQMKAMAAAGVAGLLVAMLQSKWKYRAETWFRVTLAGIAVAHILVIALVRIPEPSLGAEVMPFVFLDGFIMYCVIKLVQKLVTGGLDHVP